MNSANIGKSIALFRRQLNMTQDELSDLAGLSYSTVAKIERGAIKSPSIFTIAAIARALGTSIEELLKEERTNPAKDIKFVYSDMNGVLVQFFERGFTTLAAETGSRADIVETTFWKHNDEVNRGKITLKDFNQILQKKLAVDSVSWADHYIDAVKPIPKMQKLLQRIQDSGLQVGLLTNTMPGFVNSLQSIGKMPNIKYDQVVDSSVVKQIKPDVDIYKTAQKAANVEPGQILFIDDRPENLKVAKQQGWQTILFNPDRAEESTSLVADFLSLS